MFFYYLFNYIFFSVMCFSLLVTNISIFCFSNSVSLLPSSVILNRVTLFLSCLFVNVLDRLFPCYNRDLSGVCKAVCKTSSESSVSTKQLLSLEDMIPFYFVYIFFNYAPCIYIPILLTLYILIPI